MKLQMNTVARPVLLLVLLFGLNVGLASRLIDSQTVSFEVRPTDGVTMLDSKTAVQSVTVLPQEDVLPSSPLVITSYRFTDSKLDYVQLYNVDGDIVSLYDWRINYTISTSDGPRELSLGLTGYLPKRQYSVFASSLSAAANADAIYDLPDDLPFGSKITGISVKPTLNPDQFQYDSHPMIFTANGRYDLTGRSASTGGPLKASKYEKVADETLLLGQGLYDYDEDTNLRIAEILATTRDCSITETETKDCFEYVELYNLTDLDIDLSLYSLRIGWMNDASISSNNRIPLSGILESGKRIAVYKNAEAKPLSITASSGNVWLEDIYGLHNYTETLVEYNGLDDEKYDAKSWSIDDSGAWKWSVPTPGEENNFEVTLPQPEPCAVDEYRSSETGRCRKIVTATAPTPCKEGQYRSEETGRCRSIVATVASALKPCDDDEFRNPATGRCKKIASTEDILEPCKEGYERNPETNRCRKVLSSIMPSAEFPVEPIKQPNGSMDPTMFWAISGAIVLVAGYGIWEWRKELIMLPRKFATLIARK